MRPDLTSSTIPKGRTEFNEIVDLARLTAHRKCDAGWSDIDGSCLEYCGDLQDLAALTGGRRYPDQHDLSFERLIRIELSDTDHVDEFVELLLDLLHLRSVDHDRHTGHAFVRGWTNRH